MVHAAALHQWPFAAGTGMDSISRVSVGFGVQYLHVLCDLKRKISNVDFFAIEAVYADLTFELVRMFLGGLTTFALRGVGDALSCGCVSELMLA